MGVLSSAATVFFLCACGTVLTLYAVHVQRSRQDDAGYRALCDVDEVITCSEIIAEDRDFVELIEWACRRVGVAYNWKLNPRQPALRIAFFPLLCFLGCLPVTFSYFVATLISSLASLVSAYLLYVQFYVHDQICLPCAAEYFLHILLFLVLAIRWANSGSGGSGGRDGAKTAAVPSARSKSKRSVKKSSGKSSEQQTGEKASKKKENSEDQSGHSSGKEQAANKPARKRRQ